MDRFQHHRYTLKTHLPPARRADENTRTSAPTPELSRSLTRARFTARSVEPASMSCSAWERKTFSAGPSLSGPSRSRMAIRPCLAGVDLKMTPTLPQKLSESQALSKRMEVNSSNSRFGEIGDERKETCDVRRTERCKTTAGVEASLWRGPRRNRKWIKLSRAAKRCFIRGSLENDQ
jgi:hypothetical protein